MKKNTEVEENTKADMSALKRAKTQVWITLAIGSVIAVGLGILLGVSISPIIGLGFGVFVEAIVLGTSFSESKRIKRNFCKHCGAKYDYERCVAWETTDVEIKEKKIDPNNRNKQTAGSRIEHIEFVCTCENCGEETTFKKKFETATLYSDGSMKKKNLEKMIKNYFKV